MEAKTEATGDAAKYGGCEGPDAMYVKLVSHDGHEFIIKREYALTSGTIKAMLSGPGKRRVQLPHSPLQLVSTRVVVFFLQVNLPKTKQTKYCSEKYRECFGEKKVFRLPWKPCVNFLSLLSCRSHVLQ